MAAFKLAHTRCACALSTCCGCLNVLITNFFLLPDMVPGTRRWRTPRSTAALAADVPHAPAGHDSLTLVQQVDHTQAPVGGGERLSRDGTSCTLSQCWSRPCVRGNKFEKNPRRLTAPGRHTNCPDTHSTPHCPDTLHKPTTHDARDAHCFRYYC